MGMKEIQVDDGANILCNFKCFYPIMFNVPRHSHQHCNKYKQPNKSTNIISF